MRDAFYDETREGKCPKQRFSLHWEKVRRLLRWGISTCNGAENTRKL